MRWKGFLGVVAVFACTVAAQELPEGQSIDDERDYQHRMQDIDHSFDKLVIESERFWLEPDSQRNAARLTDLFHSVEVFWKGRGNDEAAGFARMAREGAERAQEASRMRDEHSFDAAVDAIAASCEGCHAEADDKFRIRE